MELHQKGIFSLFLITNAMIFICEASPFPKQIPVGEITSNVIVDESVKQANQEMSATTTEFPLESIVVSAPAMQQEEHQLPATSVPSIQQEEVPASNAEASENPTIPNEENSIQSEDHSSQMPISEDKEQNEEAPPILLSTPKETASNALEESITTPDSSVAAQEETQTSSSSSDKGNSEQEEQIDDSEESGEIGTAAEEGNSKPAQNPTPATDAAEQAEEDEDSSSSESDSEEYYEEFFPNYPNYYLDESYEYGDYYYPGDDDYDYDKRKLRVQRKLLKKSVGMLMRMKMPKLRKSSFAAVALRK